MFVWCINLEDGETSRYPFIPVFKLELRLPASLHFLHFMDHQSCWQSCWVTTAKVSSKQAPLSGFPSHYWSQNEMIWCWMLQSDSPYAKCTEVTHTLQVVTKPQQILFKPWTYILQSISHSPKKQWASIANGFTRMSPEYFLHDTWIFAWPILHYRWFYHKGLLSFLPLLPLLFLLLLDQISSQDAWLCPYHTILYTRACRKPNIKQSHYTSYINRLEQALSGRWRPLNRKAFSKLQWVSSLQWVQSRTAECQRLSWIFILK